MSFEASPFVPIYTSTGGTTDKKMTLEERIRQLPPDKQAEVIDFVEFLHSRPATRAGNTAALLNYLKTGINRERPVRITKDIDQELLTERESWQ